MHFSILPPLNRNNRVPLCLPHNVEAKEFCFHTIRVLFFVALAIIDQKSILLPLQLLESGLQGNIEQLNILSPLACYWYRDETVTSCSSKHSHSLSTLLPQFTVVSMCQRCLMNHSFSCISTGLKLQYTRFLHYRLCYVCLSTGSVVHLTSIEACSINQFTVGRAALDHPLRFSRRAFINVFFSLVHRENSGKPPATALNQHQTDKHGQWQGGGKRVASFPKSFA